MIKGNKIIGVRLAPDDIYYIDIIAQAFKGDRSKAIRQIIHEHRHMTGRDSIVRDSEFERRRKNPARPADRAHDSPAADREPTPEVVDRE